MTSLHVIYFYPSFVYIKKYYLFQYTQFFENVFQNALINMKIKFLYLYIFTYLWVSLHCYIMNVGLKWKSLFFWNYVFFRLNIFFKIRKNSIFFSSFFYIVYFTLLQYLRLEITKPKKFSPSLSYLTTLFQNRNWKILKHHRQHNSKVHISVLISNLLLGIYLYYILFLFQNIKYKIYTALLNKNLKISLKLKKKQYM